MNDINDTKLECVSYALASRTNFKDRARDKRKHKQTDSKTDKEK